MRLIDADKLWKDLDIAHLFDDGNPRHIAQEMVEEQPTVNPYEWISVEDRLPKKQQEVIVYRGHHSGLMNVYTYLSNNEWEDDYGYWGKTNDEGITHWMPLPEPPK